MARNARDYHLADFYHIMVQGDERKFIFNKSNYKDKYIYLLKRNAFRNDIKIIAYCVMDNHVHILVHAKEQERMSKMMLQCNTSYGIFFSKERGNIGHVFRERYRSEVIYTKTHLLNCIKYIHQNPVKASITKNCKDYPFSSFNEYLNNNIDNKEFMNICDITYDEYMDLIKNSYTDSEFLEDEAKKEESIKVFDEIKEKYDLKNLTEKEMLEIYLELKDRCKISKTQISKLLNIERRKFARILSEVV